MTDRSRPTDSFSERVDEFVASLPAWARPPFIGMLAVYMIIAIKAIYLFPITVCVLVLGGPEGLLTALWILILAGIAGFAGGVAFTLIDPFARRIGRIGPYLLWSCSFGAYITTAVLLIDGHREGGTPHLAHLQAFNWWLLGIGSVVFGSFFAHALTSRKPTKRTRWVQRVQKVTSRVHPPAR
jgi:hypothetical protein